MHRVLQTIVVVVASNLLSATADAASINYGNFGPIPPGVTFIDVTDRSGTDAVPLYGPPTPFVTGLDFDPVGYVSSATGGSEDTTDGQVNFTLVGDITPPSGVAIASVGLFEAGDFTLLGVGTVATQAIAGASVRITVTEVDGAAIAPLSLTPVNASVGFNLVANPGVVQPWSLGATLNVDAGSTSAGVPFTLGATRLEVVIDNVLNTLSESGALH